MNKIRNFIRTTALIVGVALIGFYGYVALTDVTESDANKAIAEYANKCEITIEESVDLFSYVAAKTAKRLVSKVQDNLISEQKVLSGQGGLSDITGAAWHQLQKVAGYNHEQRIHQISMKSGIAALEKSMDKCDLFFIVNASKKFDDAVKEDWNSNSNFSASSYSEENESQSSTNDKSEKLTIVPEPASDCDLAYNKAIENAGLVPKEISIHGPEDDDFSGYGCPYRITPAPGTKVQAGSTVTFRSA